MVRHAFRVLTDDKVKTRLIAFSDDMDGLRKVPDNVPNKDMLAAASRQAADAGARSVRHDIRSSAQHNNARLRAFLDHVRLRLRVPVVDRLLHVRPLRRDAAAGAGALRRGDEDHAAVAARGAARRPIRRSCRSRRAPASCCRCRSIAHDAKAGTITLRRSRHQASASTTPVTGGRCKLQWKPDWAMRWVALGVDYEMAGKDLINSVKLSGEICRALGGAAAGGLQLRALPRREGPEDLQVEGQRPDHRRMAALRQPGIAVAVHVSRAEGGEAALLRRDPAPRRRVPAVPRRLSAPGRQAAAVESGLAHPFRQSAEARHADHVLDAADAGVVVERRECRDAVGLHRPLPAGRDAADASEARRAGRLRDPLFPRLRAADEEVPRADRERAHGADRSARRALAAAEPTRPPRRSRTWSTRSAGASRSSITEKKAKDGKPGVSLDWFNMLYQVLLGQEKGPRFGSFVAVYGVREHGRHDRRRAGAERVSAHA